MNGNSSKAPEVSPYSEHWLRDEGTSGFRIVIDPARQFMYVVLWGEWRNAQTDGLVVAHAKAVAAMKKAGARHGEFLTLVDMREKLMSIGEVVAEFQRSFAGNSPSLRSAIVVSSALPTTMGTQIAPSDRVLITYTLEQALAWLFPHGDLPASIADLRL